MNMVNNKLKRRKPQILSRRTTQFWSRDKVMALGVAALLAVGGVVLMSATSAMAANSSIGTAITRDDVLGDGAYQVGEVHQPSGGGSSNSGNGWYDVHEKDPVGGDGWYDVHENEPTNSNDGWYDIHEKEPMNSNGWYDVTERPTNGNDGWYDITENNPPSSIGDGPAIKDDDVADLIPPAIKDDNDVADLIPPAIKDDDDDSSGLIPPAIKDDDDVADLIPPAIKDDEDDISSSAPGLIPPATLPDDSSSSGGGASSGGSSGGSSSSGGGSTSTPSNPSGDKPSGGVDGDSGGDSEQQKPSLGFVDGDSGERKDFVWSASAPGDATIVTFHWRFDGGAWQQCDYADAKDEVDIPSYALVMEAYVTDSDGNDSEHVFWDIIEHMQVSSFRNDTVDVSGDLSGIDTSDANGADTVDDTTDDEKGDANNGKLNSVRDMTGEYGDDVTTTTEVVDGNDAGDVRSDTFDTDDVSDDSGNSSDGNGVGSDTATSGAYVDDADGGSTASDAASARTHGTAYVDGDDSSGYSGGAYDTGTSSYDVDSNPLVQTGASAMVGVPVLSGIAVVIAAIGRKFRNMR